MLVLAVTIALFSSTAVGGSGGDADGGDNWSFPDVSLEIGSQLPNLMLPRVEGGAPVALYDLLDGKPTLLHIYASW